MVFLNLVSIIVFFVIFSCVRAQFIYSNGGTADERTVRAGGSISFNCVASSNFRVDVSMEWITPCTEQGSRNNSSCNKRMFVNQTGIRGLRLTIEDAKFLDAGFYLCQNSGGFKIHRRIYLFVKDDQHLLKPPVLERFQEANETSYFEMPLAFGQTDVLIGCAPTYPENAVITLTSLSSNNASSVKQATVDARYFSYSNEIWSYQRYYGFTIKKVQSWDDILYRCSAKLYRKPLEAITSQKDSQASLIRTEYILIRSEISEGVEIINQNLFDQPIKEGGRFELKCRGKSKVAVMDIQWKWVPAVDSSSSGEPVIENNFEELMIPGSPRVEVNEENFVGLGRFHTSSILWSQIPKNASGYYVCCDKANKNLPNSSIKLTVQLSESDISTVVVASGSTFRIICKLFIAQENLNISEVKIEWKIPPGEGFDEQTYYKNVTTLRERLSEHPDIATNRWAIEVHNASYLDTGLYTCFANLKNVSISHTQYVSVWDAWHMMLPPATQLIEAQQEYIFFYFSAINGLVGCAPTEPSISVILRRDYSSVKGVTVVSSLSNAHRNNSWTFDEYRGFQLRRIDSWTVSGDYMCIAKRRNKKESDKSAIQYANFKIEVIGVEIVLFNDVIIEGDSLNITCRGKNARGNTTLEWRWTPQRINKEQLTDKNILLNLDETLIQSLDGSEKKDSSVEYPPFGAFDISRLSWTNVPLFASGYYECRNTNDDGAPPAGISLVIQKSTAPKLLGDDEEVLLIDLWEDISLKCAEQGALPVPSVRWFLYQEPGNEIELTSDWNKKTGRYFSIGSSEHQSELLIQRSDVSATYKCRFENWQGVAEKMFYVQVRLPKTSMYLSASLVTLFVLIFLGGWIIHIVYRQKKKDKKRVKRRADLLKGNINDFNRNGSISSQVELLPYDPRWEFPIERLVFGKYLGSGHYGRVIQAKADGITGPGVTTVAVKMVKSHNNNNALKSLVSELKVLMHLGSHLNIVSLLGAVTKNIVKGELMVIVELCRNGNLRDFLRNNRQSFKDLLNVGGYLKLPDNATLEFRIHNIHKKNEVKRDVTTRDLIEWSFQIACGMTYLTKKKVLHGDLAARNVLLADDNVVKIADFGLSRRFNQHDWNYRKKSKEALPFKWMALESLLDRTFSTQSDVWSFGVTLWELFSLGKEPYPDIVSVGELIRFLKNGQRMDKPQFAPVIFQDILTYCWLEKANERKTFSDFEHMIGDMLDPQIRAQYEKAYDQFGYIGINVSENSAITESNVSSVEYLELTQSDNDGEINDSPCDVY